MKRRFPVGICAGVIFAVSGCTVNIGGGETMSETTSNRTSARSEETSPAAEPIQISSADAGERYVEIVNDVNCLYEEILSLERENSLGDGTIDPAKMPEVQNLWSRLAAAREVATRRLLDEKWPTATASEIDLIARDWSKVARIEVSLSKAPDLVTYNQLMTGYLSFPFAGNPGYVRSQLGVGPATETNRC